MEASAAPRCTPAPSPGSPPANGPWTRCGTPGTKTSARRAYARCAGTPQAAFQPRSAGTASRDEHLLLGRVFTPFISRRAGRVVFRATRLEATPPPSSSFVLGLPMMRRAERQQVLEVKEPVGVRVNVVSL